MSTSGPANAGYRAVVLDAFPLCREKKDALVAFLNVPARSSLPEIFTARIARHGLTLNHAVRKMGLGKNTIEPILSNLLQQKRLSVQVV